MVKSHHNTLSRAEFLRAVGVVSAGALLLPGKLFAQSSPVISIRNEASRTPVTSRLLRNNIHLLQGSGGNILVFDGKEGKLMVDAGLSVSQAKIAAALTAISPAPVRYLVNTHWHFDHAEGNEWIHQHGATIIAHTNTRKNLAATITVKDWNYTFSPVPKGALPKITFPQDHTMRFNDAAIQLKYYQPSHTNSDISVYFPEADLLHVGDTWWNAHYPFIDHDSGGSIDGMIGAVEQTLSMVSDNTLIIPGHGAVGRRSELVQYRDMLASSREKIAKLKASGRTMQQAVKAKPTAAFDEQYGKFVVNGDFFTRLVYADV
jgi:glyoxylase-like metal-dependent hydrolase (beta-lactamase superfamily II)